jgi:hypothetical protein
MIGNMRNSWRMRMRCLYPCISDVSSNSTRDRFSVRKCCRISSSTATRLRPKPVARRFRAGSRSSCAWNLAGRRSRDAGNAVSIRALSDRPSARYSWRSCRAASRCQEVSARKYNDGNPTQTVCSGSPRKLDPTCLAGTDRVTQSKALARSATSAAPPSDHLDIGMTK